MRHQSEQGLGLLEVLIALLVLSVGLMGATSMRLQAQAAAQQAEWQHQALLAAQAITQAMRSNPSAMAQGAYTAEHTDDTLGSAAHHPCHIRACPPTGRAEHDVLAWRAHLAAQLPDGRGILQAIGPTQRRIVVMWSAPSADNATPCPPPWDRQRSCWVLEVGL
jgi:type IV pilus assembly protein PilV